MDNLLAQLISGLSQRKVAPHAQPQRPQPAPLNASPAGNMDSWSATDPKAMYPPVAAPQVGRQTLLGAYPDAQQARAGFNSIPDHITAYQEPGIQSIGGKVGNYGGNVGFDNGQMFANMNRQGQPTDPMAELRRFLGL